MQTRLFPTKSYDEENVLKICEQAMRFLIFSGDQAPVELFLRGLKHPNKGIRRASIFALLRLNARSHRLSLRALLQDEEWDVQVTAAWALACWEEPVPRELFEKLSSVVFLPGWIAEVFPSNWSAIFPLGLALECVSRYHGLREDGADSENMPLFRRLAGGISPEPLIAFLQEDIYFGEYYAAWTILKAQDRPLPLGILPVLLSRGDAVGWEAALLVGKHRIASASDLLGEMWALTEGKPHAAMTIALDDLGKIDAVDTLCSELQRGVSVATAAIWGLGILGRRGRVVPRERLRQMLRHSAPEVRAEAILTLSSLNDMSLAEALEALNDTRLEPVVASFQAFLTLAHAQIDIPTDLLTTRLIDLQNQQYHYHGLQYNGYVVRDTITKFIQALDELHADIPLDTLLDALAVWERLVEPLIIRYWQRHDPDIFAEMMAQAEAFLQQHL